MRLQKQHACAARALDLCTKHAIQRTRWQADKQSGTLASKQQRDENESSCQANTQARAEMQLRQKSRL